jgi:FkbH-like protein
MYQAPYTKFFLNELALYLDSLLSMYSTADKKVIVLDCDNTLWNGIVGEDGAEGISCDLNSKGILYFHFQQFLLSRKKMGFILCLCSKNNEKDVREAFLKKRMPLKWDDFIVTKVNWENKDKNIKDIAEELNLGLDSFVFVDDSDFEVMHIERSLPEVKVFKMTGSYTNFMRLSSELVFKKKVITDEDKDKSEQYLQESKRKVLQRESSSFDDYIKTLEIKLKIDENPIKDLARISQLTEKTNQFNFNKIFYSIDDLRQKIESEQLICYSLRVSDKFGDYGLVGVILVGVAKDHLWLENYILSCRILGRRIEFDFLESVEMTVVERYGKKITKIIFKETPKNVPAQNFITQLNRCL